LNGNPVALTSTDNSGTYVFNNLPSAHYQVVVLFELDQPSAMTAPVAVDVTTDSKVVNLNFSGTGTPVTDIKTLQVITFNALESVAYMHDPVSLSASASSGLGVTYSSSNTSVASITGNQITIVGAGTATITASQAGNATFGAASVDQVFEVLKADQTITFDSSLPDIATNADPITLQAESSAGLPITFAVTQGGDVVTVAGTLLTLTGKGGNVTVEAQQSGNNNYNAASSIAKNFKVDVVLGIEPQNGVGLTLSPNPTKGILNVRSESVLKQLSVTNLLGVEVQRQDGLNTLEHQLNLADQSQGLYILNVATEKGKSTFRIIVTK
jgi:hypothetical protein